MKLLLFVLCTTLSLGIVTAASAVTLDGSARQTWGYVTVRPGAHMFWWLYYTTATENYAKRPLVLWLQGGPGASGTGFGNFAEIGPQDVYQNPRNSSWVNYVNVLFIDNPVGSGFSYVESEDLLVKNNLEIAKDLVTLLKDFFSKLSEFQSTPFYIFSESYGGKMATGLARQLYKEITTEKMKVSFKGLALGDSWISPVDSVNSWSSYLFDLGLVDAEGAVSVSTASKKVSQAVSSGNLTLATELWSEAEDVVDTCSAGVNFYNILSPVKSSSLNTVPSGNYIARLFEKHVQNKAWREDEDEVLTKLMNGAVREKLRVVPKNVTWGGQSNLVFSALAGDFMQPVTETVEALLNNTQLSVNVYSGQLDLVVATKGTLQWVQNLRWPGAKRWSQAKRSPILVHDIVHGYHKTFKNFAFYWISRAGHMVPADNPEASLELLKAVTKFDK